MQNIILNSKILRECPDPLSKSVPELANVKIYTGYVQANQIPKNLPMDVNPRPRDKDYENSKKTEKYTFREIKESILDKTNNVFHHQNLGLFINVSKLEYANNNKEVLSLYFGDKETDGVFNGGTTYHIIKKFKNEISDNIYVPVKIYVGLPKNQIANIVEACNTATQIQEYTLAEYTHKFDWIQECIKSKKYADIFSYRENQSDGIINIKKLIQLLTSVNIELFPNYEFPMIANGNKNIVPIISYSSQRSCFEKYINNMDSYKKFDNILNDLLELHDHIHYFSEQFYREDESTKNTKTSYLYMINEKHPYVFPFINKQNERKLFDGIFYPIFSSLRFLIEEKNGHYTWKFKSFTEVKNFYNTICPTIFYQSKETIKSANNPNSIGKEANHWKLLYSTVKEYYSAYKDKK